MVLNILNILKQFFYSIINVCNNLHWIPLRGFQKEETECCHFGWTWTLQVLLSCNSSPETWLQHSSGRVIRLTHNHGHSDHSQQGSQAPPAPSHYKYNLKIICIWKIQNLFLSFYFAINNWRLIRLSSNNLIRRDVLKWLFLQMVKEQEIQFNAQRTSVNQRRSSVSCDCTLGLSEMKRVI